MRLSTEAKVGLFVLVGLLILGYMSFRVGQQGIGLKKGYVVEAVFDNVAGLNKDASVQIAGVEVGRVESIKLRDGKAVIQMRITPDVKLEKDVRAAVKEAMEAFSTDAGGIMLHGEVGQEVPFENIQALYEAFYEYGQYPLNL